jgi:beta-glucosidase
MHCAVDLGIFKNGPDEPRSDLGWYLNPDSMLQVLREAGVHKKPIIITETGLADGEDRQREWYMRETIKAVQKARTEGIDVQGYLHWTLVDNFEWDKGRVPKFGLASVDQETMDRTLRPSAYAYQRIIEAWTAE